MQKNSGLTASAAPNKRDDTRLMLIIGISLVILVALAARIIPGPRIIDDAYITFRYSRNIVEGQGFVYNPGEYTLGTTTPLYTLLMAAISFVLRGEDFPTYAIAVNALADAGTAVLLFLIVRRLTGRTLTGTVLGVLLGVLWGIAPMSVTFAVGGMETSLSIFFAIAAVWLYLEDRVFWMGIVVGLGFLTRIDALLWIGPLLLYQLVEQWRNLSLTPYTAGTKPGLSAFLAHIPWRTWLAAVLTSLPWLLFSLFYFGSPIPHSLLAKSAAYLIPPGAQFTWLLPRLTTPFFESGPLIILDALIYLVLNILGIVFAARKLPRLLPYLIYPWLYFIVFSIANPPVFRWYTAPPLPAVMLGIVSGVWAILERLQRMSRTLPFATAGVALVAVLWGGSSLNAWTAHPDHGPDRPAPQMAFFALELNYEKMATLLRDKYGVASDTLVASADIGTIGYFSRARIIDTVGLVTPALTAYYPFSPGLIVPGQNYAIPPQMILDTKPEYLVTMEAFVRLGLEEYATFRADYGDPVEMIPTGYYGTDMRVYKRKS